MYYNVQIIIHMYIKVKIYLIYINNLPYIYTHLIVIVRSNYFLYWKYVDIVPYLNNQILNFQCNLIYANIRSTVVKFISLFYSPSNKNQSLNFCKQDHWSLCLLQVPNYVKTVTEWYTDVSMATSAQHRSYLECVGTLQDVSCF